MAMYNVSADYKTQIKKPVRNPSILRVNLGVVDLNVREITELSTNSELHISELDKITQSATSPVSYATLEHNKFNLSGTQVLPPTPSELINYYQGYISGYMSNSERRFTTNPYIRLDFEEPTNFLGLSFNFDILDGNYPTEIDIITYLGGVTIDSVTIYPTNPQAALEQTLADCDRMDLIIKETSLPYRRVRIQSIDFGITKVFDTNTLISASWERDIDLLSTKLPKEHFEFKAYDLNREYNPENAQGIWEKIERRQPVEFEYGYKLDDGSIEWVKGGNYLTTGEIKSESKSHISTVSFKASSELTQETGIAYKGIYRPNRITMYQLAINVLDHAGITNYEIDEALQDTTTSLPLPAVPFKEALQIIANAARGVLYTDRSGKFIMRRVDEALQDFHMGINEIKNIPTIDKLPMLADVETYYNSLQIDTEVSELVKKEDIDYLEPTELSLTYPEATDISVITDGLTVHGTPELYATSCVVVISGSGVITIKGKKLNRTKVRVIHNVNDKGYLCPVENPLIDNYTDAKLYAEWVADILTLRNNYSVENRGFPEMDVLDKILVDTLFSDNLEVLVTNSKITYNGALSGSTKYIALGVE